MPSFLRRVDIVLGEATHQEWFEVKSLLNARYISSNFGIGSGYQREFYADLMGVLRAAGTRAEGPGRAAVLFFQSQGWQR
ncbi:hypothetical protein ABRP29_19350 [Pseudomonas sp. WHRI 8822A]|uniref:hypothetical protein n=1 Tax=Pseudomonas sp. WHRI 8822A TaxID=3162568 RepID=UPI0032EFCDE9